MRRRRSSRRPLRPGYALAGWLALGLGFWLSVMAGYCVRNPEALANAVHIVESWADPFGRGAVPP